VAAPQCGVNALQEGGCRVKGIDRCRPLVSGKA